MIRKLFLFIFLSSIFCLSLYSQNRVKVVSYNIWYDNPNNAGNSWADRKTGVIETLRDIHPDIFGVQEALAHQVADLEFGKYKPVGVGRDDGQQAGEYAAVFYDTTRFEKLANDTFWLSEYPDSTGLKGWNAVCVRIATWVYLKEINTGTTFYVFNTHFDHIGDTARLESAKLIKRKISEIAGKEPVILTGDFNCKKDSKPFQVIVERNSDVLFIDSRTAIAGAVTGPEYSFVGSDFKGKPGDIIDHIFVTGNLQVENSGILLNCGLTCPSDHLPVFAEISGF